MTSVARVPVAAEAYGAVYQYPSTHQDSNGNIWTTEKSSASPRPTPRRLPFSYRRSSAGCFSPLISGCLETRQPTGNSPQLRCPVPDQGQQLAANSPSTAAIVETRVNEVETISIPTATGQSPLVVMVAPEGGAPQSGRGDGSRGRHRGRGRGSNASNTNRSGGARRGRGGGAGGSVVNDGGTPGNAQPLNPAAQDVAAAAARAHGLQQSLVGTASQRPADEAAAATENGAADDDADVCFICANPVAHHSIAPCNHTTCHICGLRMRALYKTKDCAHCRTPAPFVIFTDDADKRFEDYSDKDITTTDSNVGIKYTKEDIVGDTVLLLRYNCPDDSCDFAGLGWPDLHRHVKTAHRKRMCDLCTRNKKVFTHEHELFSDKELERHMRHGDDKPGAADQTGFKGHPLCGFCGERFYDDDKLYEHCRMKHERCFLCDRRDSRKPHYYMDYNALEEHFRKDHYLCVNSECMEKKFVVFESELDLQAHHLSEHAGKAAGRDARLVDISTFDIRQAYQPERRGGGGGGRGQRDGGEGRNRGRGRGVAGGGRGRDPNEDVVPPTSAQPLRRDEIAFQRQMAIHSAQSVSNRTFGGQLTAPVRSPSSTPTPRAATSSATTPNTAQNCTASPMGSLAMADTSNLSAEERVRAVRHSSVVERAANLLGNDASKVAAFRDHVSSYRRGGFTAPQLIDAFFTLFADVSSNALGTLVREVADLFDDKAKADSLRTAWQDWRNINGDYPSLPGLSGMHGATSSSSGWGDAAAANPAIPTAAPSQKHSSRVLKLKNSTRLGGPTPTARLGSPGWSAPPAVRAPPSSAFPSLPTSGSSSSASAPRSSWVGSASQQPSQPRTATSVRPAAGGDAFPALPAAPKPTTTIFGYGTGRGVRRDYGHADSGFQWGGGGALTPATEEEHADEAQASTGAGGKGKKGSKKGKTVLAQWG
ncbi:E3 ubiquitin-protein ligase hel2 [Tolypocladium capitatum]|uniref:RING-type E3 ubiquitin transferase n=1 Tax=Tolypocladium capitatum TaxID=45235 RepID=A0A2K3Q7K1_9HYPO|nr:E3 ubiquitin-protein ligase hel2 [Tolypocladium capitatum]